MYLDSNATTRPSAAAVAAARRGMEEAWGNPSSVHRTGQAARRAMELARAQVATLIGAKPAEVVFTSGGTEANRLALEGVLQLATGRGQPAVLLTTPVEHAAVREPAAALERRGVAVRRLPVDGHGVLDPDDLAAAYGEAPEEAAVLASVHWANNETGVIQPIEALAAVAAAAAADRAATTRFHTDATQAVGKLPVDLRTGGPLDGVDLLTLSAHKLYAVKGSGALFVRRRVRLAGVASGGPQERGLRAGTENLAGILALGAAADESAAYLADPAASAGLAARRDRFEAAVRAAMPGAVVPAGGARFGRLANTANIAFPGLLAEAILLGLSERGVDASAGAACSSGSLEPSPVLLAMGLAEPLAHGSVRFSLSRHTTDAELDEAVAALAATVGRLGRLLPTG
ncbi:cysteine desulfurase [Phycisphaera mikurensis NBRC 102666]|uniref:cysteine desulfurase n=1 Tax=Phycisphaera mikurensis (strain NBRC 102666 / KCTC 22515 / FYK2301M01) TaxID=1142394 RepID=I0IIV8_PHYMF|nr:cysteine desulfurase [Phycisphaera mikurensis NBRC 102666]